MDIKGIKILYAWFLLIKLPSVNGLDVNPVNPKKFDTVVITANASGLSTVIWEKDTITLTSCYVSIDTCSSPNKIAGATIAVNKGVAESTITIPSANQTFHGGLYDATGSNPVEVIINTLPVNINWTVQPQGNLTTGSSATWTAKIYCVFPTPEINVDFTVHIEGVKEVSPRSPTLSKEADPNCDFPEETVVAMLSLSSSDIQTFLNKKVYIIANASHGSFPTEPSVTSGQSAEAIFQGKDTTTVGISTTAPDEQSTTSQNPTTSSLDLQTTDATDKPDASSFSEISTDVVSIYMFSVNRDENMGEDHLHLILIIVVSSVCGVIFVSVITVVIVYLYSNKSNKCNRSVESDKKKNCDRNEPKGEKRPKDRHQLSKTKNEYQFYDGRVSRNNHAFALSETVNTRQNHITNMTNRRDFEQIVTVPLYNSPHKINNSRFYRQTSFPIRTMLALPQSDYNSSRSLCNQQERLYLGGHHFKDRRTLSPNPFAQQRSNVMNGTYRDDCQLYNSTHSGYYHDY